MAKKPQQPGQHLRGPTKTSGKPASGRSRRNAPDALRLREGSGTGKPAGSPSPRSRQRPDGTPESQGHPLFIVGIGASAGGLEALEHFFNEMPADCNLAFVVVTHQPPGHTGLLQGLLKKHTRMRVVDVLDGMKVEPNCVYLAPAAKNLSILHGTLYVMEPSPKDSLRLPIDFFFRALAQDQKHRAIGIILSGAGSDGSLGLASIKGEAGIALVQDPMEAEYPGMPQSALAAKVADLVLPVAEIPDRLLAYVRHPSELTPSALEVDSNQILPKIFTILRDRTGNDFSLYKPKTLLRRIERRMNVHEIETLRKYLGFLQEDPHETEALFQELLVGVTSFFRDPPAFETLWRKGLVPLLKSKPEGYSLRVWVPGCSTGEEAYSLAIALREALGQRKKRATAQIFATDLDKHAIEVARAGLYPPGIANDVSSHRLQQFFTKESAGYRVRKEIRNAVIFAPHNVLSDPPFTKLDVISCRNLLIYLEPKAQRQILLSLHYALKPGGLLLLGSSETVSAHDDLFACLDRKWKLFARKEVDRSAYIPEHRPPRLTGQPLPPPERAVPRTHEADALKGPDLIQSMLLDQYVPASVVINDHGEIVFIHGRTGVFLEPAPGPPSRQLIDMARPGLRSYLAEALLQITRRRTDTLRQRLRIKTDGGEITAEVAIRRLAEPDPLRGLILITFEKTADLPRRPGRTPARAVKEPAQPRKWGDGGLLQELQYTKHRLQQSTEELETAHEEFKATNEELQSTNEELQSTNEELETAKEELQSLNEELVTLNTELQGKLDELSNANDDLQNLLNSTEVATVFLDPDLRIRRFNEQARQVISLIPTDVGRPLSDIATNLSYPHLIADIQQVMVTLVRKEVDVQTADGRWYSLRVLPYRTSQNLIDGAVLAFVDVTPRKQAEQAGQAARLYAESIVETVREPLLVLDADLRVVSANTAFYATFHITSRSIEGQLIYRLANGHWDIPRLREMLEQILPQNNVLEGFEVDHVFPGIGRRKLIVNARRLLQAFNLPGHILVAFEDATDRRPPSEPAPPASG